MNQPYTENRPDIVLMVSDDHGREALGCYGNPNVRTPHLDELAGEEEETDDPWCHKWTYK